MAGRSEEMTPAASERAARGPGVKSAKVRRRAARALQEPPGPEEPREAVTAAAMELSQAWRSSRGRTGPAPAAAS